MRVHDDDKGELRSEDQDVIDWVRHEKVKLERDAQVPGDLRTRKVVFRRALGAIG